MSALSQADGSRASYRSICGKTTWAYYVFEIHTLLDTVTIFITVWTNLKMDQRS